MSDVSSYQIKEALALHCYQDFFMTEVKSGPTQYDNDGLKILDAIAIKKSWAHPCIRGFEVKVSRSDFLRDAKWYTYFPYVNEFYMVCPKGMIDRTELPDNCGLLYYSENARRVLTKKKATYTNGQPTADMLMYIIMNKLDDDRRPFFSSRADWVREYLLHKNENQRLGFLLSTKLPQRVDELEQQLKNLDQFESDAKRVRLELKAIDAVLKKHGITYWRSYRDDGRAEEIDKLLTRAYPEELDRITGDLQAALSSIAKLKKEQPS
jgi:hypothetical protein